VLDVDGNRFVDLAAGFGALLLGHRHPTILRIIELQASRLLLALGDVHPAEASIALSERLASLYPGGQARVILGQSGADAVTAALKTAVLATGRPGVVAFEGAYHGLSYAPLAGCGLRASYREPFVAQLNPHATLVPYPADEAAMTRSLEAVDRALAGGAVGAVLVEPILGRGGCVLPPAPFLGELSRRAREAGALLIADEIWTGLGRSGAWLRSTSAQVVPDLVCLGKGLGGGLPMSACIGSGEVMTAWKREPEVVHTSTFAGWPLACATAIATLDTLKRERLVERSATVGASWLVALRASLEPLPSVSAVRGCGLMVGVELASGPGSASTVQRLVLERGYLVSTGGGERQTLVLSPALTVGEKQLAGFVPQLTAVLRTVSAP
jgi:4-aminobutyrate aminotransferase/(S)-3-amino-2-methylpropionate transaminase